MYMLWQPFLNQQKEENDQIKYFMISNGEARTLKKLRTSKGDYSIKHWFSTISSLFKMGTSLKGKNLLPEGANSFLSEQFLVVWEITFTTLGELPRVLLFLLRSFIYCVMGATPISLQESMGLGMLYCLKLFLN